MTIAIDHQEECPPTVPAHEEPYPTMPAIDEGVPTPVDLDALADEVEAELRMLKALPTDASPALEHLPGSALEELGLYQYRTELSGYHVAELTRALAHDGDLKPVLVLRRGGRVFLIDGRHRKAAYEEAGRGDAVPVVDFPGTPVEALLEGQRRNREHTLAMTKDERMDGAWKLVKLDAANVHPFTLSEIMSAAGISRGQVTFMRRVLRDLGTDGHEHMQWRTALREHKGTKDRNYSDQEIEQMLEAQAFRSADKITKATGNRLANRPEVFARVVEVVAGRRVDEVIKILNERNPDQSHEWEGEGLDDHSDF